MLDINIPTLNGLRLFEIMIQKGIDTPAIFITGIGRRRGRGAQPGDRRGRLPAQADPQGECSCRAFAPSCSGASERTRRK